MEKPTEEEFRSELLTLMGGAEDLLKEVASRPPMARW